MDGNTFPILDIIHENLHFTPSKCAAALAPQNHRPNSRSSDVERFIVTPTIDERKGRVVYRRGSLGNPAGQGKGTANVKERIGELKTMSKAVTRDDPRPKLSVKGENGSSHYSSRYLVNGTSSTDASCSSPEDYYGSDLRNAFLANGCRRLYEIQNRRIADSAAKDAKRRQNPRGAQNGARSSSFFSNGCIKSDQFSDNFSDMENALETSTKRSLYGRCTPKKLADGRLLLHSLLKTYYGQRGRNLLAFVDESKFCQSHSCSNFHHFTADSPEAEEGENIRDGQLNFLTPTHLDDLEEYHLGILHEGWKKYSSLSRLFTCWQPLEGQLSKYTNVVKGWQFRWFVLNPEQGKLEYFEKEEHKRMQRPSRGSLMLAGAVICPSDEDSQTFIVNAANGEVYRLKAFDAKERQHWVNRLRATAEYHVDFMQPYSKTTEHLGMLGGLSHVGPQGALGPKLANEALISSSSSSSSFQSGFFSRQPPFHMPFKSQNKLSQAVSSCINTPPFITNGACHATVTSSIRNCAQQLSFVQDHASALHSKIEKLPTSGSHHLALDKELLLLKASSSSALTCLQQCLHILQYQASQSPSSLISSIRCAGELISTDEMSRHMSPLQSASAPLVGGNQQHKSSGDQEENDKMRLQSKYKEVVEDTELYRDTDLGSIDEQKPVILNLLSQLKLGMDLTKVVLPTFILERRSLLEMFADCMAHPDLFLSISDQPTPELRMLNLFEWYLTSFHAARQGSIAKKPYNPVVGETFHCMWQVESTAPVTPNDPVGPPVGKSSQESAKNHRLYYCAEQVSHHPPVSAFYFECPEKGISMEASIWTRSKFMGMSVGVMMIGKIRLRLLKHDEEYEFSLPSAYARSILTVPWVELGDKVNINCEKTGCSAGIVFHTKPFYGGKLHKITAETKNSTGEFTCHVSGEWNGALEFNYANGRTKTVDTTKLTVSRKCVRPIPEQEERESRKLWFDVTESLKAGDVNAATRFKHVLEEDQRKLENLRKEKKLPIPLKYFTLEEPDVWRFKHPLRRASPAEGSFGTTSAFE